MPTDEIPMLPTYRDLGDRTWVQLRETTSLAMIALAHLTQRDDTDMARTTLLTMNRILSPDWDGQIVTQDDPAGRCPVCAAGDDCPHSE